MNVVNRIPRMYDSDINLADSIFANQCLHHINGETLDGRGPGLIKEIVKDMMSQFSNSRTTFHEVLAVGKTVAVRWTWQINHQASRKEWTINGNTVFHFQQGKITEYWAVDDRTREMQSHGFKLVPPE